MTDGDTKIRQILSEHILDEDNSWICCLGALIGAIKIAGNFDEKRLAMAIDAAAEKYLALIDRPPLDS